MASTQVLKSRIRSVKNTKQITKAMQLVSASKMRRAQEIEKASLPYTVAASEILSYLASQGVTNQHPLYEKREVKTRLIIVIAADKGLAGAYNNNVSKLFIRELKKSQEDKISVEVIAIGKRASQLVSKVEDISVIGTYEDLGDRPDESKLQAIVSSLKHKFVDGDVDAVDVIYTEFVNSLKQTAISKRVLPAGFSEVEVSESVREAKFEPSEDAVLDGVTIRLISAQIYQALLDAKASEHSMRMVAMKSATDNASELADDLTLVMNKARQAAVTQELAEISGGVEALNE